MDLSKTLTIDEIKLFLQHNKFIFQSSEMYQSHETSTKGFHTYGPNGLKVKNKIIEIWRQIFFDNNIFEIDTPVITAYKILENSGHVKKFNDFVAYNIYDKSIKFRADHLVKAFLPDDQKGMVENMSKNELEQIIKDNNLIQSKTKDEIVVEPMNLMFMVDGGFLRPEIAQGIFTEFPTFYSELEYLPFGLGQVGKSYRNEISPQPFVRLREFTQAEIEYFYNPTNSYHPKFDNVKNLVVPLLTQQMQLDNISTPIHIKLADTYSSKIINNQIMAYFLGKIYLFAIQIGLDLTKIRFREHMPNEKAHYANQCYDLETLIDGNWLECIGCADRGNYDLTVHNIKGSNEIVTSSYSVAKYKIIFDKNVPQDTVRNCHKYLKTYVQDETSKKEIEDAVKDLVSLYGITNEMYVIKEYTEQKYNKIIPYVIEPSIGIDRIIFSVFSHCLKKRSTESRIVFDNNVLNLHNIAVFQLSNDDRLIQYTKNLVEQINKQNLFVDYSSTSIGKRYVRADQLGIQYCVTVDFTTLQDDTVTVRYRNDGNQTRIHIKDLNSFIKIE